MKRPIQWAIALIGVAAAIAGANAAASVLNDSKINPANFASDPNQKPVLLDKVKAMGLELKGIVRADMTGIKAHVVIALSKRDGVMVEHAVEIFRFVPGALFATPLPQ